MNSIVVVKVSKQVFDEVEIKNIFIQSDADSKSGYMITFSRTNELNYTTGSVTVSYVWSCGKEKSIWIEVLVEGRDTSAAKLTITSEDDTFVEGTFFFKGTNAADNSIKNITEGKIKEKRLFRTCR